MQLIPRYLFHVLLLYWIHWSVLVVFGSPYTVPCHLQIMAVILLFQFGCLLFLLLVWMLWLGLPVFMFLIFHAQVYLLNKHQSSKVIEKDLKNTLCHSLEKRNLRCWTLNETSCQLTTDNGNVNWQNLCFGSLNLNSLLKIRTTITLSRNDIFNWKLQTS